MSLIPSQGHALLGRVSGADAAGLTNLLAIHAHSPPQALSKTSEKPAAPVYSSEKEETPEQLNAKLKALMEQAQVVLFMKGSPEQPQCGFSRKIVALLQEQGVQFKHFDILKDESVRQGMSSQSLSDRCSRMHILQA
jgi:glutaredoxin-related protein